MKIEELIDKLQDISGMFIANNTKDGKIIVNWEETAKAMKKDIDILWKKLKQEG